MIEKNIVKKSFYSTGSVDYKKKIIGKTKSEYFFYLSLDKWFQDDKIYYKIDYLLDNKVANIIPNKKINISQPILSNYKLENENQIVYIYMIPKIRPFEITNSLNYKVVSTMIESKIDEKINIFEKLFSNKKLLIKNESGMPEKFIFD
jgi:hypothetical protein